MAWYKRRVGEGEKLSGIRLLVKIYLIPLLQLVAVLENTKEILDEIKATVREYISDAEVMLFGSRARGDAKLDSDFDILVITSKNLSPKSKFPLRTNIRISLLKKGIRSDILIQSRKEVNNKKKLPGHIIRSIFNEAILL